MAETDAGRYSLGSSRRPSAETLTKQVDDLKKQIDDLAKRDNTGVHRINTETLHVTLRGDLASLVRKWGLVILGVLGIPVGLGTTKMFLATPNDPAATTQAVKAAVDEESAPLEAQVRKNTEGVDSAKQRVNVLGREFLRRDDERAQQLDHVITILLKIHPKAQKLDAPPAVQERMESKERQELDARVEDLFGPDG